MVHCGLVARGRGAAPDIGQRRPPSAQGRSVLVPAALLEAVVGSSRASAQAAFLRTARRPPAPEPAAGRFRTRAAALTCPRDWPRDSTPPAWPFDTWVAQPQWCLSEWMNETLRRRLKPIDLSKASSTFAGVHSTFASALGRHHGMHSVGETGGPGLQGTRGLPPARTRSHRACLSAVHRRGMKERAPLSPTKGTLVLV